VERDWWDTYDEYLEDLDGGSLPVILLLPNGDYYVRSFVVADWSPIHDEDDDGRGEYAVMCAVAANILRLQDMEEADADFSE
jgi:hypothetical protein